MEKITEMPAMQACDERSRYAILDTRCQSVYHRIPCPFQAAAKTASIRAEKFEGTPPDQISLWKQSDSDQPEESTVSILEPIS